MWSQKYFTLHPSHHTYCYCFCLEQILLDPKYREQYCQLWTGLEDGEVMDPECMKWSTEEIAVGWLNCAISQMLGGSSQDVYPCLCLALSSCGNNWPMRLRLWNEILTCVASILGPTKASNMVNGEGGHPSKSWKVDGRWSGWQMHSVPTEQEHCLPPCDTDAPLDVSCKLMKDRGRTFKVFLELVRKLLLEAHEKDELKGLQLPQVKCADRSLSRRMEVEAIVDLAEVVSILGPQLKNLTQGEVGILGGWFALPAWYLFDRSAQDPCASYLNNFVLVLPTYCASCNSLCSLDVTPVVVCWGIMYRCRYFASVLSIQIVALFEMVITSSPPSPSMVTLALDVASLLPSRNLAQWWVPLLVNALISAYPPASSALWSQSIEVIEAYSKEAAKELEQCQQKYPLEIYSRYWI